MIIEVIVSIMLISLAWHILQASAWREPLKELGTNLGLIKLFKVKLTDERARIFMRSGPIKEDIMRINLINKIDKNKTNAMGVVVDRTAQTLANITLLTFVLIFLFYNFRSQPANIRYGIPVATIAAMIFMFFFAIHQKRGIFGFLILVGRRFKLTKQIPNKLEKKLQVLDSSAIEFYKNHGASFRVSFLMHLTSLALGLLEIYILGKAFDEDFSFTAALTLSAIVPITNAIFFFIPSGFVILEVVFGLITLYFGFPFTTGLAIQLARRLRELFWALIGSFIYSSERKAILASKLDADI